jgi:hypothetical protein
LYLSRQGQEAMQTDEPVEANRDDNLGEPVPGDHGAHGSFAARSRHWSSQFKATKNRKWLALAGVVLAAIVFDRWRKSTNREEFLASEDGL